MLAIHRRSGEKEAAAGQLADFVMERAAEGDGHLLKAAAQAEHRHATLDGSFDQGERQGVAAFVVGLMARVRLHVETGWMHIGAPAGEQHAVNRRQQRADVGDLGHAREHQRQRAGHLGDRAEVAFACDLRRKFVFGEMRVRDHADHRSGHTLSPCSPGCGSFSPDRR